MVALGQLSLYLGLLAGLVAVFSLLWGRKLGPRDGESVTNIGYIATFAAMGALTVSVLVLLFGFLSSNFTILYVAENHSTDVSSLRWLYDVSGVWAGREGSLLFWAWLVAIFASYVAYRRMDKTDDLSNMGLMVTNVVLALFSGAMIFSDPNAPFKATPAEYIGAGGELVGAAAQWGMNPLLQHWAMILHPPTLFIGYAGLTIPFAFAIAALIVNDPSKRWIEIVDRITVFSWLFLGAGIGLGSVWAYVVLGWGGYWAWDPVENASLLPWLTGVGLIHSFTIYRRRDSFKRWAIFMAAFTFALVILGTFITRSGIVQSVHAFAPDIVSLVFFLGMILGSLVAAGIGIWLRWDSFAGNDEFESLTGKEAAYYFNNLIMVVAATLVAYMTVSSALPAWLPFGGQSIGATSYDLLARPIGVFYAFIIAVCPLLAWRATDKATFWKRMKWPLVSAVVIFGLLMAEWFINLQPIYVAMLAGGGKNAAALAAFGPKAVYDTLAILGLLSAALLISTTMSMFIEGSRKRAAARGESFLTALGNIIFKSRTQSGGYLAHIAMGIIMIGLVGSSMYVRDVRVLIDNKPGESFKVSNYTFTFQGISDQQQTNGDVVSKATFAVQRDGKNLGTTQPGLTRFARQGQTRLDAAVYSEALRDIFVVWEGNQPNAEGVEQLSVNVKINPLIWFAWGGFALLLLGTALAAWPKKRPELAVAAPVKAAGKSGAKGQSGAKGRKK
jgi:cytochrome c-type biogenesis protein CcmF